MDTAALLGLHDRHAAHAAPHRRRHRRLPGHPAWLRVAGKWGPGHPESFRVARMRGAGCPGTLRVARMRAAGCPGTLPVARMRAAGCPGTLRGVRMRGAGGGKTFPLASAEFCRIISSGPKTGPVKLWNCGSTIIRRAERLRALGTTPGRFPVGGRRPGCVRALRPHCEPDSISWTGRGSGWDNKDHADGNEYETTEL